MSGRHYRVVKRLRWIEGGDVVFYEPGDTVYLDDREATATSLCYELEAIDDAGRALLEEARATFVGDLDGAYGPYDIEREYADLSDGTRELLWTRYVPQNPLPGVVYDDNGLPDSLATALQREQWEKERQQREMENQFARIRGGASRGGRRGRETKRDKAARSNEALLTDVRAYRAKHPSHGCPAIAKALVGKHGSIKDHADPRGREKAIEALRKRIGRLGGSLDR